MGGITNPIPQCRTYPAHHNGVSHYPLAHAQRNTQRNTKHVMHTRIALSTQTTRIHHTSKPINTQAEPLPISFTNQHNDITYTSSKQSLMQSSFIKKLINE